MKQLVEMMNRNSIMKFIIRTAIPFALPFIFEIPNNVIIMKGKIAILLIAGVIDFVFIYLLEKDQQEISVHNFKNQAARYAYSNAYELNERKRDYLLEKTYKGFYLPKKCLPYNIHDYIAEICKSFRNLISQITSIDKEYISVSFIYRYIYKGATENDLQWRWVVGRELTMQVPLNIFVTQEDTLYNALMTRRKTVIFSNSKLDLEQENSYYMSDRDKRHRKVGSVFAARLMLSNNANKFAEGILVISTYGKCFVENNETMEVNKLRKLIIDDLFPYYQRLLETELGILYLRHHGHKGALLKFDNRKNIVSTLAKKIAGTS